MKWMIANAFRTKFIEEEWRVELEGRQAWMPVKSIAQKLYIYWENGWIHESQLIGETVNEKDFVSRSIEKIPPSGYNDQYSKVSIQW